MSCNQNGRILTNYSSLCYNVGNKMKKYTVFGRVGGVLRRVEVAARNDYSAKCAAADKLGLLRPGVSRNKATIDLHVRSRPR